MRSELGMSGRDGRVLACVEHLATLSVPASRAEQVHEEHQDEGSLRHERLSASGASQSQAPIGRTHDHDLVGLQVASRWGAIHGIEDGAELILGDVLRLEAPDRPARAEDIEEVHVRRKCMRDTSAASCAPAARRPKLAAYLAATAPPKTF